MLCTHFNVIVSAIDKQLLTSMVEMQQSIKDIRCAHLLLMSKVDSLLLAKGDEVAEELPDGVKLPIGNLREFENFQKQMESREVNQCTVTFFNFFICITSLLCYRYFLDVAYVMNMNS
jgi:hypothetical protein